MNSSEAARLLRQYAGIFPGQAMEYGELLKKRSHRPKTNYAQ
jgi:hypothetical protein